MKKMRCLCLSVLALLLAVPTQVLAVGETVQWLNHLDFLAGDASVVTEFNAVDSGVGTGLSGLVVSSTTTGETSPEGGIKAIEQGPPVPPGFLVRGVRVCYESTSAASFISQVRLAQLQDPPATATVLLDDGADLVTQGPVCVNSAMSAEPINPAAGALRLSLRVNFADIADRIVIRGVGLITVPDPNSPLMQALQQINSDLDAIEASLQNHTHSYLTGKGTGHNNVVATTGGAMAPDQVPVTPTPTSKSKKKKGK